MGEAGDVDQAVDRRSVADPLLERGQDHLLVRALHRKDERKPEAGAVPGVERPKAGKLLRRQPVQAGAGLLLP